MPRGMYVRCQPGKYTEIYSDDIDNCYLCRRLVLHCWELELSAFIVKCRSWPEGIKSSKLSFGSMCLKVQSGNQANLLTSSTITSIYTLAHQNFWPYQFPNFAFTFQPRLQSHHKFAIATMLLTSSLLSILSLLMTLTFAAPAPTSASTDAITFNRYQGTTLSGASTSSTDAESFCVHPCYYWTDCDCEDIEDPFE